MAERGNERCPHRDWTCFYERISDQQIQAFCMRCKKASAWATSRETAERLLTIEAAIAAQETT